MTKKAVIYIDNDDDITSLIDKASASEASIIALVLPKRYPTLRSSVNMKLLKKTSDEGNKKLVLITDDDALRPLAGNAGIYVADSLKSHPVLPKSIKPSEAKNPVFEEVNTPLDLKASIGELAGDKEVEKFPVDNSHASDKSEKIKKIKGSQKIKVPNFDRFRFKFFAGIFAVIGLTIGWYVAFRVMPKANVTIYAQTARVVTKVDFTIDHKLAADNITKNTIKGTVKEVSKTVTERFTATGEKDNGTKASGVMTIANKLDSSPLLVTAGTIFTEHDSGGNFQFTSDADVTVPGSTVSGGEIVAGTADVAVTAVEAGGEKNIDTRAYTVDGYGIAVTGIGSNMTGGNSNIVKVISADDIAKAKKVLLGKVDNSVKTELAALFPIDSVVIDDTFTVAHKSVVSSQTAGTEASEASVSAEFTYSIVGITPDVMSALLEQKQASLVDTENQTILDNGLGSVKVIVNKKQKDGSYVVEANTIGFVGPEINVDQLSAELAGKRYSAATSLIKSKPGIKDVEIKLSPFWVFSMPSQSKIVVNVEVSDSTIQ